MEEYDYSNDPEVKCAKEETWVKQIWKARPALCHKNGGRVSLYVGQSYDPEKIDLVDEGWTHDHCEICYFDLYETENLEHGQGYTNGQDWICEKCYLKYIKD